MNERIAAVKASPTATVARFSDGVRVGTRETRDYLVEYFDVGLDDVYSTLGVGFTPVRVRYSWRGGPRAGQVVAGRSAEHLPEWALWPNSSSAEDPIPLRPSQFDYHRYYTDGEVFLLTENIVLGPDTAFSPDAAATIANLVVSDASFMGATAEQLKLIRLRSLLGNAANHLDNAEHYASLVKRPDRSRRVADALSRAEASKAQIGELFDLSSSQVDLLVSFARKGWWLYDVAVTRSKLKTARAVFSDD